MIERTFTGEFYQMTPHEWRNRNARPAMVIARSGLHTPEEIAGLLETVCTHPLLRIHFFSLSRLDTLIDNFVRIRQARDGTLARLRAEAKAALRARRPGTRRTERIKGGFS